MTDLAVRQVPRSEDMDVMTLGRTMAASGFFADSREAAQAVVKILAGRELGIPPVAAMMGVNIIKGKVTLSAGLVSASIKRSGKYDYTITEHTELACEIEFFQNGDETGTSRFTMEDARRAGLAVNANWKTYPKAMLFSRAITQGARWYTPDIFLGPIYTPDELGVEVDVETGEIVGEPSGQAAPSSQRVGPAADTSGEPQSPAPENDGRMTPAQKRKIEALIRDLGWTRDQAHEAAGVRSFTPKKVTFDMAHRIIDLWQKEVDRRKAAEGDVGVESRSGNGFREVAEPEREPSAESSDGAVGEQSTDGPADGSLIEYRFEVGALKGLTIPEAVERRPGLLRGVLGVLDTETRAKAEQALAEANA